MANEIQWVHAATGSALYAVIRTQTGTHWNTAGTPNFEARTVANWADYDIALTESPASSYFYTGTFPAISGNMVAGWYWVDVYLRAGAGPAISDTLLGTLFGYWDGTLYRISGQQTGDAYAVVNHADYGNAQLVRSFTPANKLAVDAANKVAVPDTQKVDVETIKTRAVTCGAAVTVSPYVGNATAAISVDADGIVDAHLDLRGIE